MAMELSNELYTLITSYTESQDSARRIALGIKEKLIAFGAMSFSASYIDVKMDAPLMAVLKLHISKGLSDSISPPDRFASDFVLYQMTPTDILIRFGSATEEQLNKLRKRMTNVKQRVARYLDSLLRDMDLEETPKKAPKPILSPSQVDDKIADSITKISGKSNNESSGLVTPLKKARTDKAPLGIDDEAAEASCDDEEEEEEVVEEEESDDKVFDYLVSLLESNPKGVAILLNENSELECRSLSEKTSRYAARDDVIDLTF